ncbi:MAG: DUF1330 domain-containing protein [Variibacter sp.]|nr:DUF1330 domain-containing protein [Variibacter sp.]
MQYVVWGGAGAPFGPANGLRVLASGEVLELEGPWTLGSTTLAYAADDRAVATLPSPAGAQAFAVEGIEAPGEGEAFVIAAHRMLDPVAFRPYAEAIPGLLEQFGVRSLARGGKVTPLAGDLVPDRGVVLEFPSVAAVIDFYFAEIYAPLLDLRLRTTDPRFVVVSRAGTISPELRRKAETLLRARAR